MIFLSIKNKLLHLVKKPEVLEALNNPISTKKKRLEEIKVHISDKQFERLSSIRFRAIEDFILNKAHEYEGKIFHEMCILSVTPELISELRWANHKYNIGEEPKNILGKTFTYNDYPRSSGYNT